MPAGAIPGDAIRNQTGQRPREAGKERPAFQLGPLLFAPEWSAGPPAAIEI